MFFWEVAFFSNENAPPMRHLNVGSGLGQVTSEVASVTSHKNVTLHEGHRNFQCYARNKIFQACNLEVGFCEISLQTRKSTNLRGPTPKKTWQPQTETRFTRGRLKKRANSRQASSPDPDPYQMLLRLTALIEEQLRFYSDASAVT